MTRPPLSSDYSPVDGTFGKEVIRLAIDLEGCYERTSLFLRVRMCSVRQCCGPEPAEPDCSKTVPKPGELIRLGLALSEKQSPQTIDNAEKRA